jgi:hypothetical protein
MWGMIKLLLLNIGIAWQALIFMRHEFAELVRNLSSAVHDT